MKRIRRMPFTLFVMMAAAVVLVSCATSPAVDTSAEVSEVTADEPETVETVPDEAAVAPDPELERAINQYDEGRYNEAIEAFAQIAQDGEREIATRRTALQYLGRAYLARNEMEYAREAIHELLELEPPLVELNPDVEPPPLMRLYYEVRKEFAGSYEVEREDSDLHTMAIMDFTNSSVDDFEQFQPMQQGFASMFINHMSGATDLRVIERERLQWLLEELELQRDPQLIDQSTAVQSGQLLGASTVLFGSFTVHGDQMQVMARLVQVETGEILLSESVRGERDNFFDLAEQLSLGIAQSINVALDQDTIGEQRDTQSLDAMMAYSEGLVLLEREEYEAAYEKFNEALEYDPEYERARARAQSVQPLLS